MERIVFSWSKFQSVPIVGIMRNIAMQDVVQILPRYLEAGFNTIEIAMNTPDAEGIIRNSLAQYPGQLNIGAGTVCNASDLDKALLAGAQFIVTPVMDEQIINTCVKERVPVFSGAYTPSEIYKAWNLGASMVKVFPASTLGPAYLKELRGPLGEIKLMPTGGITIDNCVEFFRAGAAGLGIGSQLFVERSISDKNWDVLTDHFKKFIVKINARNNL